MKPAFEIELSETEIQSLVLKFLKAIKVRAWRNNIDTRGRVHHGFGKGSSDIIANFHGFFTAIEIKKPGEEPDEDQWKFINDVISDGGIGFYACSVDEVRKALISAKKRMERK